MRVRSGSSIWMASRSIRRLKSLPSRKSIRSAGRKPPKSTSFPKRSRITKSAQRQVHRRCLDRLPNYLHTQVAIDAIKAGKHVMLDKPMATSAKEAQQIIDAWKEKKVSFMVGQNFRFNRETQMVKEYIKNGEAWRCLPRPRALAAPQRHPAHRLVVHAEKVRRRRLLLRHRRAFPRHDAASDGLLRRRSRQRPRRPSSARADWATERGARAKSIRASRSTSKTLRWRSSSSKAARR